MPNFESQSWPSVPSGALAAGADRKIADMQHVVIKTGEFQRDGIGVLTLPNHAAGT